MNREIKFRVWDNDWKKMHKVTSVFFDYKANVKGIHFFQNSKGIGAAVVLSNYREGEFLSPLMQYTGLKDKNGKEIYEGDILKVPDDWDGFGWMAGQVREIYFSEGAFRLKPNEGKMGYGHTLDDGMNVCEIIGNIYENPELLTTQPQQ